MRNSGSNPISGEVVFGFDEGFRDGMIMPAAAQGAACDPVIRGHGPAGEVPTDCT
jgi:hypothetical protein